MGFFSNIGKAFGFGGQMGVPAYQLDTSALDERSRQIEDLRSALTANLARYNTQIGNMMTRATQNYANLAQTQLGTRGLQPSGGAFASAMARQQADALERSVLGEQVMGRENLMNVDALQAALQGMRYQGAMARANALFGAEQQQKASEAQYLGGLQNAMFGGLGALAGQAWLGRMTPQGQIASAAMNTFTQPVAGSGFGQNWLWGGPYFQRRELTEPGRRYFGLGIDKEK